MDLDSANFINPFITDFFFQSNVLELVKQAQRYSHCILLNQFETFHCNIPCVTTNRSTPLHLSVLPSSSDLQLTPELSALHWATLSFLLNLTHPSSLYFSSKFQKSSQEKNSHYFSIDGKTGSCPRPA